jgi:hypothetical protein
MQTAARFLGMIDLGQQRSKLCAGVSRRSFLKIGSLAAGGLSLPTLLRTRAQAGDAKNRPPRAVIQFYLEGGLTHHDSYDPKPAAPREIRGPFSAIDTAVPGVQFSDQLPRQAQIANKLTALRAVSHGTADHATGQHWMLTGYPGGTNRAAGGNDQPATGAVVSALLGSDQRELPSYMTLSNRGGGYAYRHAAYLGVAHNPFDVFADPNRPQFRVPNLAIENGLEGVRLDDRLALVHKLDSLRRDIDQRGEMAGLDAFTRQAFHLITGARAQSAFQIDAESTAMREQYGRTRIGQCTLLARRLVEAGVPFITVHDVGWDNHDRIEQAMRGKLPPLDQALAALVTDLDERGLLDDVLILLIGEFGRTPRINANAGRDHWGNVFSVLLAGGGLRHCGAYGASNAQGASPVSGTVSPGDIFATMYHFLGIDPHSTVHDLSGRPVQLLPEGTVLSALV